MENVSSSQQPKKSDQPHQFPPVVSVLGHVDHGKTSLLDSIRKSSIATRETGGITQRIGASEIETLHEGKKRRITFIDTPGHEAFANMRSQGVNAADVVLLIIAADDGIKPQTEESIQKIKESGLPYIVVLTKIDLEAADPDKVKQQLLAKEVLLEDYGGSVPSISVSSKTGEHVKDLLDLILLVYDLSETKKDKDAASIGVVIDAKIDKRRGIVASIVVKQGIFSVSDKVYAKTGEVGKVRNLFNTLNQSVKQVFPGEAVEILGLTTVLPAGSIISTKEQSILPEVVLQQSLAMHGPQDLKAFFGEKEKDTLPILLKSDTSGELEAVLEALPEKTEVVYTGQGDISVSDILLAKDFGAFIVGFNVQITKEAKSLADTEKVLYRTYTIIYELLDEVREGIASLIEEDTTTGSAKILARFESDSGPIIGVRVTDGKIAVQDTITLLRNEKEIGTATITSLKKGKQDAKEATSGIECGIRITPALDFLVGDVILSHK